MKRKLIKLIRSYLKRPDLNLSEEIPWSVYFSTIFSRVLMLARGLKYKCFFAHCGKRFCVGKRVEISCGKKMFVGNNVSVQDQVIINAVSKEGVHLSDCTSLGIRTMIKTSGSLGALGKGFWLGSHSTLGNDCFVGAAGGVVIGEYVAIGQNVRFHSENHNFDDVKKRICDQGVTNQGITIGSDCWIGAGAVFLDGSSIGDGCVVGANSVVTKTFPANVVIAGNPARIVRYRGSVD